MRTLTYQSALQETKPPILADEHDRHASVGVVLPQSASLTTQANAGIVEVALFLRTYSHCPTTKADARTVEVMTFSVGNLVSGSYRPTQIQE